MIRSVACSLPFLFAATLAAAQPAGGPDAFPACLAGLKRDAVAAGIAGKVVDQATAGVGYNARVIELDRAQPEFFQTFWRYFETRVTDLRVQKGRELMAQNGDLLRRVEAQYGVPATYLVSFWGLESNFGQFTGGFRVVESLATLACDPRRADFFKSELFSAFRILAEGAVPPQKMLGSWAGAMGQTQFMPSTFTRYALDYDGDGRRDLWSSLPDVMGSSARYLSSIGWKRNEDWGREVRLPAWFAWEQADLEVRKSAAAWRAAGVTEADGSPLRDDGRTGSVVLPGGWKGPAFLVFDNFRVILAWNRSLSYAVAVGHLADRLAGGRPLVAVKPPDDEPMSREQVLDLQNRLVRLGYDVGNADGVVGAKTRVAAKAYQKQAGLPADGYPSLDLLRAVRVATGG
jgi:membrane-bound lytic murein transglycosylase B